MNPDPESHLLSVLSSHASSLGSADISWAFAHAKSSVPVSEYISTYLLPSCVLSLEESAVRVHLEKTGQWRRLASSGGPPLSEREIALQAEDLRERSRVLRERAKEVRAAGETLAGVRSRRRAEGERRKRADAVRRMKWVAEREELLAARDDLVGILREEVADLRDSLGDNEKEAEEVERVLLGDDRVLLRLEKLAAGLVVAQEEDTQEEVVERMQGLIARLAAVETRAVRKRLERVFREKVSAGEGAERGPEEVELQKEIDSLYAEIPTVAQGAAYNQFLAPLMVTIAAATKDRGENWALGGEYICQVLRHLRNRLAAMTSFLSSCHDRDGAVMTLIATIEREAGATVIASHNERPSTPTAKPQPPRRLGSPVKFNDAASKLGRIPYLTPARRRGKSVDFSKDAYPELALLSHLGISLPPGSPSRIASTPPVITDSFLAAQIAAAAAKVESVSEFPTDSWEAARAQAADVARLLREGLWAGNEYEVAPKEGEGSVVVVRQEIRDGGKAVENGVKELSSVMGRLIGMVDEIEGQRGDVGREGRKGEFVGRWGR
ncbi:hypothetical protein BZA05DRAFT_410964 [Tricharina praecox]|uniref:uncharacterized protein n=1 Tax=Tricharina praecox TaxID=43433 RepID=UPI00221F476C|nr:uncharacterized protein BZA05DRAFT_410964 [Tricharina praecox]KAI5843237.1 hypothetical protein BZA05DRAFT_410964 [Tricharina praecox]